MLSTTRSRMKLLLLCAAGATSGCVPLSPYDTMATYTLRVGEHSDADVVWVEDTGARKAKIYRCSNFQGGPQCLEAKMGTAAAAPSASPPPPVAAPAAAPAPAAMTAPTQP